MGVSSSGADAGGSLATVVVAAILAADVVVVGSPGVVVDTSDVVVDTPDVVVASNCSSAAVLGTGSNMLALVVPPPPKDGRIRNHSSAASTTTATVLRMIRVGDRPSSSSSYSYKLMAV